MAQKKIATTPSPDKPQPKLQPAKLHQMLAAVLSGDNANAKETVAFILEGATKVIGKGGGPF